MIAKVREARVKVEDKIEAVLYDYYDSYDDGLEYVEIDKVEGKLIEFPMGCFDVCICINTDKDEIDEMIEDAKRRLQELEESPWNEEEAIIFQQEYIEYLQEKKKAIEEADETRELVIEYSRCKLTIGYENEKGEYVKIEADDDKEIVFKNVIIKVEKF
jgi:hypothetical protein